MYQHWLVMLLIASAPFVSAPSQAASPKQKPAAEKPASTTTQKPAGAAAKGVRTVEIVGTEDMKYSVTNIPAKRGEQLRVRLVAKGAMPKIAMSHNFVLLNKGTNLVDFATAAMQAAATGYIPADKKGQILANTALAGAGETVEVTFKVPAAAGEYPYVCTFPGHFQAGMRGTLTVK
jgi:azurin